MVRRRDRFRFILLLGFVFSFHFLKAQPARISSYGVPLVADAQAYRESIGADSGLFMMDLHQLIPSLVLDLRYAGTNNFMKRRMYPPGTTHTYLRKTAAAALASVQSQLNVDGYGLKIFDAYRPYSVTVQFWELVHDDRYVADPHQGSGHNRGIAVDLTLVDLHTGQELEMPTGFDNFTDSAHQDFAALSAKVLQNRQKLRSVMEKNGFLAFATEWWHFSLPHPEKYAVLDLSFDLLGSLAARAKR